MMLLLSLLPLSLFGTSAALAGIAQESNNCQMEDSKLETIFKELGKLLVVVASLL